MATHVFRTAQDVVAFGKAQIRDSLSRNPEHIPAAIANFIVAQMPLATDLYDLLKTRRASGGDELDRKIEWFEVRIREEFLRYFGHDMIAGEILLVGDRDEPITLEWMQSEGYLTPELFAGEAAFRMDRQYLRLEFLSYDCCLGLHHIKTRGQARQLVELLRPRAS